MEATLDSAGNLVDSARPARERPHDRGRHDRRLEPALSHRLPLRKFRWQTRSQPSAGNVAPPVAQSAGRYLSVDRPRPETLDKLYSAMRLEFDEILHNIRTTWEMQTFKLTQGVDAKVAVPKLWNLRPAG